MESIIRVPKDTLNACLHDYRFQVHADDSDGESFDGDDSHRCDDQTYFAPTCVEVEAEITLEQALSLLGTENATRGSPNLADCAIWIVKPLLDYRIEEYMAVPVVPQAFPIQSRMKAHCVVAYAYFKKYIARTEPEGTLPRRSPHVDDPVECIMRAAWHANRAACMHFLSPMVLTVGFALRDLAERFELDVWEIKQFVPLWRALERYEREVYEETHMKGLRESAMILPSQTVCAARGCTVSVESLERALTPCSGNCTGEWKPWYCSPACQIKDWKTHRDACKPPRTPALRKVPPTVPLNQRTHDMLMSNLMPKGPVRLVELALEDANPLDTREGIVELVQDLPSPYVPLGETVRYVVKRYA